MVCWPRGPPLGGEWAFGRAAEPRDSTGLDCGEGTNGRLGLGYCNNVPVPRQLSALSQYVVKKVAVHSGGRHAMALTVDGRVFSCGEGDYGELGHCFRLSVEKPRVVEALREQESTRHSLWKFT